MPIRIQRKRTKGWRLPANTVCVDRSTKWGNPIILQCKIKKPSPRIRRWLSECAAQIYNRLVKNGQIHIPDIDKLKGKNLACWCPLSQKCHADVLLEIANA
jgi:Leu/Phe-tRNA-protein transferase